MKKFILLFLLVATIANGQYKKQIQQVRLAKDTSASTSLIGTPLFFYADSQSTYSYTFKGQTASSATTGITYTIYYPSGSDISGGVLRGVKKADTTATGVLPTDSTESAAFNTNSSGTYPMEISGTIATGSNRGIVMLVFKKPTSGTGTLKKGWSLLAFKK